MNQNERMTRKEFEQYIVERAWSDPAFKERLINSPKEVLEEELQAISPNFKFNENLKIHIITEDPDNIYLVIPSNPKDIKDELTPDNVSDIEGGSILVAAIVAVTVAAAANVVAAANVNTAANANVAANANGVANANVTSNANA